MDAGKIVAEVQLFKCENCSNITPLRICEKCSSATKLLSYCDICGETTSCPHDSPKYARTPIAVKDLVESLRQRFGEKILPDLIKGVRGTSNKGHVAEHLYKGILRAKHNLAVNKDGTIRYDCSEVTLTHFKPKEVGVGVGKLKELGYDKDVYGDSLEADDQILELKVQDIVLPCSPSSPDEPADEVLFRVARFIDELLVKVYGLKPFYNLKSKEDLVGHLAIGLAPHTSAGIVTRIVGFSKTQAFFAHPYVHAAMRRDCFSYDTYFPVKENGSWKIRKIGELVEELNPRIVVDAYGTREVKAKNFETIGFGNGFKPVKINNFTKHKKTALIEIKTALGKKIKTTKSHKFLVDGKLREANDLKIGDRLSLPYKISIKDSDVEELNLLECLKEEGLMVRNLRAVFSELTAEKKKSLLSKTNTSARAFYNYNVRDSYPAGLVLSLPVNLRKKAFSKGMLAAKRDTVLTPIRIKLEKDLLELIGLYVAEGYSRSIKGKKGLNQIYISAESGEIRGFIKKTVKKHFGLAPSENKKDRVTYSSKTLYLFFTKMLGAGSAAREKRIPPVFLSLPKKKLAHILRGYFEGDGSVEKKRKKVSCDTVSEGLIHDLEFCLARYGIFAKRYEYEKEPGMKLKEFYYRKKRKVPLFKITKLILSGEFAGKYAESIGFLSTRKKEVLKGHAKVKKRKTKIMCDSDFVYDPVVSIEEAAGEDTYCLNVDTDNHLVMCNSIVTRQCDGDESCILLALDAFLNFSNSYLPSSRGSTMDAPLVLTSVIIPAEVDDMAFNVDVAWKYPLELYRAAAKYAYPGEVRVKRIAHLIGSAGQYEGLGFTHDTSNLNAGVLCSAYKLLPSMADKVKAQMDLAVKLRAVDERDVAKLVIEKHFIRDTKGNLRKFSLQEFRCVNCNEKYRRPPLQGNCAKCGGKIIFTISEGSIIKYVGHMIELAEKYDVDSYTKQVIALTQKRIEGVFGREKEVQTGLGAWGGGAA
jgi:DNA polymerase II large subunit